MISPRHARAARAAAFAAAVTAGALLWSSSAPAPSRAATTAGTSTTKAAGAAGNRETALGRIQRMVAKLNKEAATPEGEAAVVARLSRQFRASPDSLRAQRASWGLGYGEVAMVYGFARTSRKAGVTPDGVVEMRRDGKAWEEIAKELGVKVDAVASRMTRPGAKGASKPK